MCPVKAADGPSGSIRPGGSDAPDGATAGSAETEASRYDVSLASGGTGPAGSGRAAGHERTDVRALGMPGRGGWGRWIARSAARPALGGAVPDVCPGAVDALTDRGQCASHPCRHSLRIGGIGALEALGRAGVPRASRRCRARSTARPTWSVSGRASASAASLSRAAVGWSMVSDTPSGASPAFRAADA